MLRGTWKLQRGGCKRVPFARLQIDDSASTDQHSHEVLPDLSAFAFGGGAGDGGRNTSPILLHSPH